MKHGARNNLPAWISKSAVLLLIIGAISVAYFARAIRAFGIWGGVAFVAIWVVIFLYQRGRPK
jgi:uncharacterized membrane protein YoaK (UPF0700 family)